MSGPIAWIDGVWGTPSSLSLPLSDRGLQLADGLFETVLIRGNTPELLEAHHRRWCEGAALLGMAQPPALSTLEPLIQEATTRAALHTTSAALRLNWSRDGAATRGIQWHTSESNPAQHRFWLTLSPHTPSFRAVRTWISRREQRNATSRLSHCKTFAYGQAIQARREAIAQGADDALLCSTTGELCCASTANLLVHRQGEWLTPPLSSGCLPGVMRQQLLTRGIACERHLDPVAQPGDAWLLINSLDCRVVRAVNGQPLSTTIAVERLWNSLLQNSAP